MCQTLFFNKVAGVRSATLLKNRLWQRCFPGNFVKFLRTALFIEHLWWLLLDRSKFLFQNIQNAQLHKQEDENGSGGSSSSQSK